MVGTGRIYRTQFRECRPGPTGFGEYYCHHDRSAAVTLLEENGMAVLSYTLLFKMDALNQWLSGVMCCALMIMRELCRPGWSPAEVRLAIPRPLDTRPFEKFFHAKLMFDAPVPALAFDANWLGRPVEHAQPELRRILLKDIDTADCFDPNAAARYLRAVGLLGNPRFYARVHALGRDRARQLPAQYTRVNHPP